MSLTYTAWIYLISAGLLEVVWAVGMKYSDGFSRLQPSLIAIAGVIGSLYLLSIAIKHIPLGIAYAVWVGIGATMVSIYGIFFLDEPVSALHIACLSLIIIGVIGLNLLSA